MKWLSIVVRSRHFCRGLSRDRPHALGAEPTNPLRDRICWSSRKRSSDLLVFAQALIRSVGLRASAHPYLLVFAQALIRSVGLRASAHPICWSSRKRSSDLLVFAQALISRKRSSAGFPKHVAIGVGHPRQNEQQVRQPVEVFGRQHADRVF